MNRKILEKLGNSYNNSHVIQLLLKLPNHSSNLDLFTHYTTIIIYILLYYLLLKKYCEAKTGYKTNFCFF